MGEQPSSQPTKTPPETPQETQASQPGQPTPKRELNAAVPWVIFFYAFAVCAALGLFSSLYEKFMDDLVGGKPGAPKDVKLITIKSAYLPLGCILTAMLGFLMSWTRRERASRLRNALLWACFAAVGYLVAELICLGGVTDATLIRVVFWGSLGAVLGLLGTPAAIAKATH